MSILQHRRPLCQVLAFLVLYVGVSSCYRSACCEINFLISLLRISILPALATFVKGFANFVFHGWLHSCTTLIILLLSVSPFGVSLRGIDGLPFRQRGEIIPHPFFMSRLFADQFFLLPGQFWLSIFSPACWLDKPASGNGLNYIQSRFPVKGLIFLLFSPSLKWYNSDKLCGES